ncbi:uncharacterized protein LOC107361504 [Tetranychus urticae]|uniref:uncharacterized protein LOC107361504 n=1 Tax=Tetranychus urticae TaxID=32264 RepID=UPI00077BE20F|nr:uncharacterized protein LOC107361504 [Tetranychus urticae]
MFQTHSDDDGDEILPGFGEFNGTIRLTDFDRFFGTEDFESKDYRFSFKSRLPYWIGYKLLEQQIVIRTFPTEINEFKENTDYTKNISLEMETSCGSSKSAFDKTDVVTLTLMEKQNNGSVFVQTIQVDPLSVDFYSPKLSRKQFKMLAEDEIKKRKEFCDFMCKLHKGYTFNAPGVLEICPDSCWTCPAKIEDKSFAEMEKFVKIMKYLQLFKYRSETCNIRHGYSDTTGIVELDKETVSSFPKLNAYHYFVASFVDTKSQKNATIVLKDYKII